MLCADGFQVFIRQGRPRRERGSAHKSIFGIAKNIASLPAINYITETAVSVFQGYFSLARITGLTTASSSIKT
jgi:hypothetical protein